MFSKALCYDLGNGLNDLVEATLNAPIEQLEAEEEALLPPTSRRRAVSLPILGSEEHTLPQSIREGIQLAGTIKAQPSIFTIRRRQSFPAPNGDMATWKKDKRHLHVI